MSRDKLIALIVFLAGVALVVIYYFATLPGPAPELGDAVPGAGPQLEITVAGEANGVVVIDLYADVAPKHVEQVTALAREGAYDGVVFHRVIDGFMAQTGDVQYGRDGSDLTRAGSGGSDRADLPAEFSEIPFEAGIVGMARSQSPNSANSQFFVMFAPGDFLNGKYTVIGKVASGFEVVAAIKRGTGANGAVIGAPDVMQSVRVIE